MESQKQHWSEEALTNIVGFFGLLMTIDAEIKGLEQESNVEQSPEQTTKK